MEECSSLRGSGSSLPSGLGKHIPTTYVEWNTVNAPMSSALTWNRYAFPPLLNEVIAKDIGMSKDQVAISNIIALVATLLVRLVAGPSCDRFGPRYTFAGCLLIGAIPTFLSGTAYNVNEMYALRFFIGILGGSFVPCQVWTTGFFDKNIVGTANSLTAGLGNAGGGITYFIMPSVYKSLVKDGLSKDKAWRVAFVVPGIVIVCVAAMLILLCPDTPTGKWSERVQAAENNLRQHNVQGTIVDVPGQVSAERKESPPTSGTNTPPDTVNDEKKLDETRGTFNDNEAQLGEQQMLDTARGEIIEKPSWKEMSKVMMSPQTLVLGACYFCTFGAELSINSILGTYYKANFPSLGLSGSGEWAAMFGILNAICRPLGGFLSDFLYRSTKTLWAKKMIIHAYSIITGAFIVAIGATNPSKLSQMVGLIAGTAFFLEGANGMNFSLVPHVHPYANGVVSGFTGASGNFGGIIFAVIFKENSKDYAKSFWIIGVIIIAINVAVSWIKPIPKGQIGGR